MMGIFTFSKKTVGKMLCALVAVGMSCTASAADNNYYYFYEEFHAYPSGAGKIYVDTSKDVEVSEITNWETEQEITSCKKGFSTADFYCYPQPADGWLFYGTCVGVRESEFDDWAPQTDEQGNLIIYNDGNPARYTPTSTYTDADSTTCVANAPLFPECCAFAVFTHVAPRICVGQNGLGSVVSSKTVNEIGDDIVLTANPKDERCRFAYWTRKSDGEKITDNPLSLTVKGMEEYVAHFDCDSAHYYNYPEGGYVVWYNENYASGAASEKLECYAFRDTELNVAKDEKTYFELKASDATYPQVAQVIYIKGEATLIEIPAMNSFNSVNSYTRWSGEEGVDCAGLSVGNVYYNLDLAKKRFTLVPDTQNRIEPNTMYLAVPVESFEEMGQPASTIYWSKEDAATDGITEVEIEKMAAKGKIYTIGGVQVKSIGRDGIYIIDGKKVLRKAN